MGPGWRTDFDALSNFRPVKRILDAVEIFALVREKMKAKLVMIGDGPDRAPAEELARDAESRKDVFFLGKQNGIQEKLGQADLFLLPSQLESFGLAALEAMACEVPVIATNTGGLPEVVEHGVDGYSGGARRREIRRHNMRLRFCHGQTGAATMGQRARADARKKFCANDVIPMYERYYERVLGYQDVGAGLLARAERSS